MSRISIDVTDAEHAKLKALAALQGQSIKEFVLSRTIGDEQLESHLTELEALLDKRRAGGVSSRTVGEIFEEVRRDAGPNADA